MLRTLVIKNNDILKKVIMIPRRNLITFTNYDSTYLIFKYSYLFHVLLFISCL